MSKYTANPKTLKNFTQATEASIDTDPRISSEFLPSIFQTDVNDKFFKTTLDHLLSSSSLESLDTYWGRLGNSCYHPERDLFNPEHSARRVNYQLAPGTSVIKDHTIQDSMSYINMLNSLEHSGADVTNHDKLMTEPGYSLRLPIDIDMMLNFNNYYWLNAGNPICVIEATEDNPIDIDMVTTCLTYKTPVLTNGKTLEFVNGLRVQFIGENVHSTSGEYYPNAVYWVENIGRGLRLTMERDANGKLVAPNVQTFLAQWPEPWDNYLWDEVDWDDTFYDSGTKEYVIATRDSCDRNAWARGNSWYSVYAIETACAYLEVDPVRYTTTENRAQRPILCYNDSMEIFNSGKTLHTVVDVAISNVSTPETILGKENYNNIADVVTDMWSPAGYVVGNRIRRVFDGYDRYYECILTHNESKDPMGDQGRLYWRQLYGKSLANDDIVVFTKSANPTYQNRVFEVSGVGESIELTDVTGVVNDFDKIIIVSSSDSKYAGAEMHWINGVLYYSQQKEKAGQSPKFQLYDIDGIRLQDHPNSDFIGNSIFNFTENPVGVVDEEFGFAPKYNDAASVEDFQFDFTLHTKRYFKNLGDGPATEIKGLYFYKDLCSNELLCGWEPVREHQRVPVIKTHIASQDFETVSIELGTDKIERSSKYYVLYDTNGYRFAAIHYNGIEDILEDNPLLTAERGTSVEFTYMIRNADNIDQNLLEFVSEGVVLSNGMVEVNENVITLNIPEDFSSNSIMYRSVADNSIRGLIHIYNGNSKRVTVRKNGKLLKQDIDYLVVDTALTLTDKCSRNDVVEILYVADDSIEGAVYDVAPVHKYNPLNEDFDKIFYSNLFEHFEDQMIKHPGFHGDVLGRNNYHILPRVTFGGTIREQHHSPSKFTWMSGINSLNPITTIVSTANDYQLFKDMFKTKVTQLHKSYNNLTVTEMVDRALQEINVGKNSTFKYANSDMVYYEDFKEQEFGVDDATVEFYMEHSVHNYGDRESHAYVYTYEYNIDEEKYTWKQLLKNRDYTIEVNKLTLNSALSRDTLNNAAIVKVRFTTAENKSFVPLSAAKIGFTRPYDVVISEGVLVGHDGSTYQFAEDYNIVDPYNQMFDPVGACLYELELRITNGMTVEFDTPFSTDTWMPNANFETGYTWDNLTVILDDWYNRWSYRNNPQEIGEFQWLSYDRFTWNYKSVHPHIGGWRGIYHYFFGTDKPHTHPWEMLGHHRKPYWWDEHYSWTDPVKRRHLVEALKSGIHFHPDADDDETIFIDPSDRVSEFRYARVGYNWDRNILVTTDGELNDPVRAGVVERPTNIEASKPFVFGDWGPVEHLWRSSSEYQFAIAEAMLIHKPYRTFEETWRLGNIIKLRTENAKYDQFVHKDVCKREGIKNQVIQGTAYSSGTIVDLEVIDGGSGYTTATVEMEDQCTHNNRQVPNVDVTIIDGKISGLAMSGFSNGYNNTFDLTIVGDGTGATGVAQVRQEQQKIIFGFSDAISEYSHGYGVTPESLTSTLNCIASTLVVHAGGYTDKNILDISVDGSYEKGRTSIPSPDYDIMLQKSAPVESHFFSSVRIERTELTFKVYGYDANRRSFTTDILSHGGKTTTELIQPLPKVEVTRPLNFLNQHQKVRYGTEFLKRQELYNFLMELGHYYETIGFRIKDDWIRSANEAIVWALDAEPGDEHVMSGHAYRSIKFKQPEIGYVDSLTSIYDGTANIVCQSSRQILSENVIVLRDEEDPDCPGEPEAYVTVFELSDTVSDEEHRDIFGLRVNIVEFEHIVAFRNYTQFNDVIFDPVLGVCQPRLRLVGERTRNWNGKMEAPGYLVRSTGIIANFETSVREIENDNINSESKTLNRDTKKTARFNTGYVEPTYLTNTFVEDNAAYNYGKAERQYKGTPMGMTAMMRNINIFGTVPDYNISEEWMIRLGDYGDHSKRDPIEIQLDFELIKSSPQLIRFNTFNSEYDNRFDRVIDITPHTKNLVSGEVSNQTFELLPFNDNNDINVSYLYKDHSKDANIPLLEEADYYIQSIDDIYGTYNADADYANILPWTPTVSYDKGDIVRKDGKVYQLQDNFTELTLEGDEIVLAGTSIEPVVSSGLNLIIDDQIVNFNKTQTDITYNSITVTGSQGNPTISSPNNMTIDGTNIDFYKTEDIITFEDIQLNGQVSNPVFTPTTTESHFITIDGNTISFDNSTDDNTNITAQQAFEIAFEDAFAPTITTSNSYVLATENRIRAIEELRSAYQQINTETEWLAWLDTYYGTTNIGLNIEWLRYTKSQNLTNDPVIKEQDNHEATNGSSVVIDTDNTVNVFNLLREYTDDTTISIQYSGQSAVIDSNNVQTYDPIVETFEVEAPADSTDTIDTVYRIDQSISPGQYEISSVTVNGSAATYNSTGQTITVTSVLSTGDTITVTLEHPDVFSDDTPMPFPADKETGTIGFATPPKVPFTIIYSTPNYVEAVWLDEIDRLIISDIEVINNIIGSAYNAEDYYNNVTLTNWDQLPPSFINHRNESITELSSAEYLDDVQTWLASNTGLTFLPGRSVFSIVGATPATYNITSIIDEINSQAPTGVTASSVNNRIRIDSTNGTLVISGDSDTLDEIGFSFYADQTFETKQITTTVHVDLTLVEIVDQINAVDINNIVANISGTQLGITKTTSETDTQLIISGPVDVLNSVGITAGVYDAETESDTFEVDLSLSEVVAAINAAGIPNVTATSTNRRSVLTSTNPSLNIGAGTANSILGFVPGVTFAPDENINSNFEDYNWAEVSDLAHYRVWLLDNLGTEIIDTENNREPGYNVYELMDFSDMLLSIEEGQAEAGDTILVTTKYTHNLSENDIVMLTNTNCKPAIDGIHRVTGIASDNSFYIDEFIHESGFGNVSATVEGTNVNPTIAIGDFITINGTSVVATDETLSGLVNNWISLELDDIVVSETIDGRISITSAPYDLTISGTGTILEDLGITASTTLSTEQSGQTAGKMLVFRPMRFDSTLDIFATTANPMYAAGLIENQIAYADVANGTNRQAVYQYQYNKDTDTYNWTKIRDAEQKVSNTDVCNITIYDAANPSTVRTYEVYDPAKGIIPGLVDRELDFRRDGDVAVYNSTTDENKETVADRAWGSSYVGMTWWDTTNAIYLDYEQSTLDYRQSNWGRLYETGSIDVYEWTKSTVLPDDYDQAVFDEVVVDGKILTGTPYVVENKLTGDVDYHWTESIEYNAETETDELYYYFWVRNKTTLPSKDRLYTVLQLQEILINPASVGVNWCAAATENVIMINNLNDLIGNDNLVIQINFDKYESDLHREYILLAEDDPRTIIPEWLHMGLRDSLARFDDSRIEEQYTDWLANAPYQPGSVVKHDGEYYRATRSSVGINPAEEYTDMYYWKRIYDVNENPRGEFTANTIQLPSPMHVPNTRLHKYNQLGIEVRPRQTWVKNIHDARRVMTKKLNTQFKDINVIRTFPRWNEFFKKTIRVGEAEYDMSCYWSWIDWVAPGFTPGTDVDYIVDSRARLDEYSADDLVPGELALAQESDFTDNVTREEIWHWNGMHWSLVWQERATIEFNENLWHAEFANLGWDTTAIDTVVWDNDPGPVIVCMLDIIRDEFFVGQYRSYYADLWFALLNYFHSEQKGLDWAFKSTYIRVAVDVLLNPDDCKFVKSHEEELINYINTVKPFHTKMRDFCLSRSLTEEIVASIEEQTDNRGITMKPGTVVGPDGTPWTTDGNFGELILDAGSFADEQTNLDGSFFVTVDDIDVLYDGYEFNMVDFYDYGSETFPAKLNETVDIRVQTNPERYIVTPDTRSFRILYKGHEHNIETTVITDELTTELSTSIDENSDTIEVIDPSILFNPKTTSVGRVLGKVFIEKERISYTDIVGNTLYGVTRGVDGTSAVPHARGNKVVDSSQRTWIKSQSPGKEYTRGTVGEYNRNWPEPGFNSYGKSIAGNDILRHEVELIRRFGKGTI